MASSSSWQMGPTLVTTGWSSDERGILRYSTYPCQRRQGIKALRLCYGHPMQADPALAWYYNDSAAELGLRAQWISETHIPGVQQRWPTRQMCGAARRQRKIRNALEQLSPRLQSLLETVYVARSIPLDKRHEFDLAAPLIERVRAVLEQGVIGKEERKVLEHVIAAAPVLLDAAHRAFHLAFDDLPTGRVARRRARVQRFIRDEGLHPATG